MSYHGGLLGGIAALVIYCRKKKFKTLVIGDILSVSVPLGYTFGRIGNFINGELYGRVTAVKWGMIFPHARKFPVSSGWVREIAEKAGIDIAAAGSFINLPRHPSQLYEAFFEGIFLWAVMWFFLRKRKHAAGEMIGSYILGYGIIRFFIEYFREPDADLGFIVELSGKDNPIYTLNSFFNFSMGQILCFIMAASGFLLIYFFRKYENKKIRTENEKIQKQQLKKRKKKKF
jgi:phosphatidylglycerol:prolipoprotein diacylglycerol transferase